MPRAYIATAQNRDDEMSERIRRHQEERGSAFQTVEEPLALGDGLQKIMATCSVVIVDCLTLWVSNLLEAREEEGRGIQERLDDFLTVLKTDRNPGDPDRQ